MTPITCKVTRQSLEAFFDEELPVGDQIAVGVHLEYCSACALEFQELQRLRAELRQVGVGRLALDQEAAEGFEASVVKRAEVEAGVSFVSWARGLFDDMHLVYAGLSAAVATLVCATIMLGTFRFATTARPESLGAIVNVLSSPGSNENPVRVYGRVQLPRMLDPAAPGSANEADAVFALATVVTREGTISSLELLHARGGRWVGEPGRIEGVMDAVARARFEPALSDDGPVALNMVWLVANTTVRPEERTKPPEEAPAKAVDEAAEHPAPAKKHVASASKPSSAGRA
jgi:hypothetical protein